MTETTIIALAGKGGVGKTSIAATIVRLLAITHPDSRILAIDADPAVGLSTALNVDVVSTVDNIRQAFVDRVQAGDSKSAVEMLGEARYSIFDALVETDHYSFLAIGRPESSGCYCKVNSYLKEVISILADNYDFVVIDGEAGIEQINRRVMEKVTHLLLISDASKKGLQVIQTIQQVADRLVMYKKCGAIINRAPEGLDSSRLDLGGIELLSYITSDSQLAEFDIEGKSIFELSDDSKVVAGAKEALTKLGVI